MATNRTGAIPPSLTIAVTTACNLSCSYCPPFGESLQRVDEVGDQSLSSLVAPANHLGLPVIRLTGGEPLLRPEVTLDILREAVRHSFERVILNTNGVLIEEVLGSALDMRRAFECKVSLDTVDALTYRELTGSHLLDRVITSITWACSNGFHVVINTVVTRKNVDGLPRLLDFCDDMGLSVKLFDLNDFYGVLQPMFADLVADSARVAELLVQRYGPHTHRRLEGERGIPMLRFEPSSGREVLLVRHTSDLARSYGSPCTECTCYPCQCGLVGAFAWPDALVSPCRNRRDLAHDCRKLGATEALRLAVAGYEDCFYEVRRGA